MPFLDAPAATTGAGDVASPADGEALRTAAAAAAGEVTLAGAAAGAAVVVAELLSIGAAAAAGAGAAGAGAATVSGAAAAAATADELLGRAESICEEERSASTAQVTAKVTAHVNLRTAAAVSAVTQQLVAVNIETRIPNSALRALILTAFDFLESTNHSEEDHIAYDDRNSSGRFPNSERRSRTISSLTDQQ